MVPVPSFYIVYNLIYLLFIIITPLVTFHYFVYFIIQLTALFSARPERLTTFPPLGAKYLIECVQVHVRRRSSARGLSRFTSLLISKSYWFEPRFVYEGNCCLLHHRLRLGNHPTLLLLPLAVLADTNLGSYYLKKKLTVESSPTAFLSKKKKFHGVVFICYCQSLMNLVLN